jgi:hypothetical protein
MIVAESLPEPALSDVKEAVLLYVPPEFVVVELTTCAVVLLSPSTVAGPTRFCSGGSPTIDQPGSLSPARVQSTSTPEGRTSWTATPVACGLPALLSVTV